MYVVYVESVQKRVFSTCAFSCKRKSSTSPVDSRRQLNQCNLLDPTEENELIPTHQCKSKLVCHVSLCEMSHVEHLKNEKRKKSSSEKENICE